MLEDSFRRIQQEVFGSGANITISGPLLTRIVSGDIAASTSGQLSRIEGYDYESSLWRGIRVTQSGEIAIHAEISDIVRARISGQAVVISGQAVSLLSGQRIIAQVSGCVVQISGQFVRISGDFVRVWGRDTEGATFRALRVNTLGEQYVTLSGEAVKISGEAVDIIPPTTIRVRDMLIPSSASGGTVLESGEVRSVTLTAISGDHWVGGVDDEAPYSGHGFLLARGNAITYGIDNFNRIRVMADTTSGRWVSYTGVDR